MTHRSGLTVSVTLVAILGASVLSAESETDTQQQGQFRATTDLVSVPVTVRSGGSPVKGLTGEDFVRWLEKPVMSDGVVRLSC